MVVLITRGRLTVGSRWSRPITAISIIVRRKIRIRRSLSSSFAAQPPSQMINLWLHGSGILLVRDVAPTLRLAPSSMSDMCANFSVPSSLKIEKMILTLGPHGFLSIWTWTYQNWTLNSLQHQNFPQTAPIVRTQFSSQAQKVKWFRPKDLNTMNL